MRKLDGLIDAIAAAHETAGVLDDGGMASHLSPRTLDDLTSHYSYLLYFLAERGKLNHDGPAAASVNEENILDYVQFLEPRVSSVTLAMSLRKIARVATCLAPEQDWRWLRRIVRRLGLRAKARDRRHEVVECSEDWLQNKPHIDLYVSGTGPELAACQERLTMENTKIFIDPPPGLPVRPGSACGS